MAKSKEELTYIYVKPTKRRQGIASKLLQICLNKSKSTSTPLVVVSEPDGYSFLVKHGFRHVEHKDLDLSQWASPLSGFGVFRLTKMTSTTEA